MDEWSRLRSLIGKTIVAAKISEGADKAAYLALTFSDGSSVLIASGEDEQAKRIQVTAIGNPTV